jgi:hypothetical protein
VPHATPSSRETPITLDGTGAVIRGHRQQRKDGCRGDRDPTREPDRDPMRSTMPAVAASSTGLATVNQMASVGAPCT